MQILNKNPLEAYGEWVATASRSWPEDALESAHREFIDTVAVMIPGAIEPATRTVFSVVNEWGGGPSYAVGSATPLAAPWAAMVNGTAAHALDYDDNFDPPKAHASTVLVPAIFAIGDQHAGSGADCLDAYLVGLQILGRVGQAVNPYHRDRGWHATATLGAIGAAAACSRMLKLDAETAARALSISTSMAAGFMSQFGTMTKPVHAGLAAKAGVVAASLAQAGLTAGMDTFEGRTGLNTLMVGPDREDLKAALVDPDHGHTLSFEIEHIGAPLLITEHAFRVKRFANCGSAHRTMDGLLELMAEHGFSAEQVAAIDIHAPKVHLDNLMHTDPRTNLEGKFSIEYPVACILVNGACRLSDFTDEAVMRPEIRALYPKIHRHPVNKLEGAFPTQVKVTLTTGAILEVTVPWPKGSRAAPFPTSQYWQKFAECTEGHLNVAQIDAIREPLAKLPELAQIEQLTSHLAVPVS